MKRTSSVVGSALFLFAPLVLGCSLVAQEQKPDATDPVPVPRAVTPQAGPATGGNTWFPVTNQDLGTYFGTGEAAGVYHFKNPTDQTIEWRQLTGSCQCAKAKVMVGGRLYRLTSKPNPNRLMRVTQVPGQPDQEELVQQISIGPGEEGDVEVHLDMNGITGAKQASLDIHTSDPTLPQIKLNFHATGAQLFTVSPSEVNLNKMTWNESREFSVTVVSPLQKDWRILRMDPVKGFDVSWEKQTNNDNTSWLIKGKYGPVDGETAGGGVLKFFSDVNGSASFTVRVMAMVQGPLEVKPGGFLTLGLIRQGSELVREISFEPNDGIKLEATELRFEKATLASEFLSVTQRQDGDKLIVELHISDKAPKGLVKGDLVVALNHPLVKEKRIMFNGFVR
ncbi:MAG: hypothetical protein K8J09_10170 [Planctomycetes bacterium]|nr:hypothetical protein [Planctomycetota bacterium]MCC7398827.1 hypothetical protein [Planctomycetota bacterium]